MTGAKAHFASSAQHDAVMAAADVFLAAVAEVAAQSKEPPAQQEATLAMQAVIIQLAKRRPAQTVEILTGVGLGIGVQIGSTCAGYGADPGPLTQIVADGLAHGMLAGAQNARPAGSA